MSKIVTVRERVHQPFYDHLIRTAGTAPGNVGDTNSLFISGGNRSAATTNLINGSTLPSDQSLVVLALRVFAWFRNPIERIDGNAGAVIFNGDYNTTTAFTTAGGIGFGNAPGSIEDYYRLHWQAAEQLHWTFGTGMKPSIDNMPTWYFPSGQGGFAALGATTDLIHLQNSGTDGHSGIARLGRAILLPPRQNILCQANIYSLDAAGQSQTFGLTQGSRNMLSFRDNLNAVDLIQKCVSFVIDGLFSRDVQ